MHSREESIKRFGLAYLCFGILYRFDPDKSHVIDAIKEEIEVYDNPGVLNLNIYADPYSEDFPPPEEITDLMVQYLNHPNAQVKYLSAVNVYYF